MAPYGLVPIISSCAVKCTSTSLHNNCHDRAEAAASHWVTQSALSRLTLQTPLLQEKSHVCRTRITINTPATPICLCVNESISFNTGGIVTTIVAISICFNFQVVPFPLCPCASFPIAEFRLMLCSFASCFERYNIVGLTPMTPEPAPP